MKAYRFLLTVFVALSVTASLYAEEVETDFWGSQPEVLTERYYEASACYDQPWVLVFADSLDA